MEQNEIWEQPKTEETVQVTEVKENIEGTLDSSFNGSQFGKFKDAESLLTAYNNLQAEFTRKCQKVSELEKEKENTKILDELPIFEQDTWQEKVSSFLNNHADAKQFASEISQELLSNPELKTEKNALEIAWANVISKKYKDPKNVLSDDKFVNDYVLSSEQIKEKIISNYIKELESKNLPPIQTASSGGTVAFAKIPKANTLSEAKTLVEQIFNTQGE